VPVGRPSGLKVKEEPVAPVVTVLTVLRLVLGPSWITMVQPESQPEYFRVKFSPSTTWYAVLRKAGFAAAAAARAEMKASEYFMVGEKDEEEWNECLEGANGRRRENRARKLESD